MKIRIDRKVEHYVRDEARRNNLSSKAVAHTLLRRGIKEIEKDRTSGKLYLKLTQREKEVLPLVLKGITIKDIGKSLFIAPPTVKVHLRNISKKFGLTTTGKNGIKAFWE